MDNINLRDILSCNGFIGFLTTMPPGLISPSLYLCASLSLSLSLSAAIIYSVCLEGLSSRGSPGLADLSNCGIIDVIHQCV